MEMKPIGQKKISLSRSELKRKEAQAKGRQSLKSTVPKEHAEDTIGLTLGASSFVIEDDNVRSDS
jgi:hypothetical protein